MEENFIYIDAFVTKKLSVEEIAKFEQRIKEDEHFAQDVAFYLSAKYAVKEEAIKEKKELFRQLLEQNNSFGNVPEITPVRKLWFYRISSVAAVLILAFFVWYLFLSKTASPRQMADIYITENLKTLPVTMGATKDSIQNGLRLYNEAQYDSAIKQFENILQKDTSNYLAKKYLGIVYLEAGNYDKSLLYFQQLENYSLFSNPSKFYQALTLLKRNQPGDKPKAKQLLQQVADGDLEGKETAQQWLKKW